MKVLVTGGAGYLGSATVEALRDAGHEVTVYDSLRWTDLYLEDVRFVRGDVRDHGRLQPALDDADAVVWLAALVGDAACSRLPEEAQAVNADAAKWMAACFAGRIVFASTCSVYWRAGGLLREDAECRPESVYARTKLEAEGHLRGKDAVVFRLGTLFGLGGRHGRLRLDLVVNRMAAAAARERRITVRGGDQWRPFLHVRDAARAACAALSAWPPGTYNLMGENATVGRLAQVVRSCVPGTEVAVEPHFGDDPRDYRVSDAAARALGWTPCFALSDGVRQVRDLVLEGRLADPDSRRLTN